MGAADIVPFGKYRGQPVAVMMADADNCAWAMAQPGLRDRYASLFTIIVNGGVAPDAPTPEHNRMQLLFRDPAMRVATYRSVVGDEAIFERWAEAVGAKMLQRLSPSKTVEEAVRAWDASPTGVAVALEASTQQRSFYSYDRDRLSDAREAVASRRLLEVLDRPEVRTELEEEFGDFSVDFEVQGWDVVIMYAGSVALELKPAVGDDYPAILRTMKSRRAEKGWWRALIVDRFEAKGASLDDVKWVFGQSGIEVRTLAEIRAAMLI